MTKFDWQASNSAPNSYPMRIVSGGLSYHDSSGSLYVPDGSTIDHGWGTSVSSHVVGPDKKPLPNRLGITFFSYTEDQFYRGNFDLPYETILKLFQNGYYSPKLKQHTTYSKIIVGVAPGGAVAVWLLGVNRTTEVFFGQAEKAELPWSSLTGATHIAREEYIRKRLVESLGSTEALAALRKNGVPIGLWSRYRTRYSWQPRFTGMEVSDGRIHFVKFFNGEVDYLSLPPDKDAPQTRPVPARMDFVAVIPNGSRRLIELYFNEAEILSTFEKLSKVGKFIELELRLGVIDTKYDLTVWLRNDKEAIELKRTELKHYGAGG